MNSLGVRLSVAPMMDWTDRHFRYFLRQLTRKTVLFTEMVTAQAVVFGDAECLLSFHKDEKPLVLQLGGSDPKLLGKACKIANEFGYDTLNLNVGCPSERVAAGCFGASLRKNPILVKECFLSMKEASKTSVSLKTRIALEEMTLDSNGYDDLFSFVSLLSEAGCAEFIIHARKAKLKGLTPKQNREHPALRYDLVYDLKKDFPDINIILNGNVKNIDDVKTHLDHVDGVMMGRSVYADPYVLATADEILFNSPSPDTAKTRQKAVEALYPYIENELSKGTKLHAVTRHLLGLFRGERGASTFRRILSQEASQNNADVKTVAKALSNVICCT